MKRIMIPAVCAIALLWGPALTAQTPPAYPVFLSDQPSAPAAALPYTTVKVYLTVEKETITAGPYARFAQRYLGVMAPLVDRQTYTITSARLDYTAPDRMSEPLSPEPPAAERIMSHIPDGRGFVRSNPDRVSAIDKSTEEMARDAANTIFSIRKQRLEILTGEAGELYAGGLEATFDELSRMENEYLALFLGRQTVGTEVHEIEVVPQSDRTSYIVCRFTEQDGILPDNDLGGQPVVLTLTPEKAAASVVSVKSGKQLYRVADFADAKLAYEQKQLAKKRIPVYQFGTTVSAPAAPK